MNVSFSDPNEQLKFDKIPPNNDNDWFQKVAIKNAKEKYPWYQPSPYPTVYDGPITITP